MILFPTKLSESFLNQKSKKRMIKSKETLFNDNHDI